MKYDLNIILDFTLPKGIKKIDRLNWAQQYYSFKWLLSNILTVHSLNCTFSCSLKGKQAFSYFLHRGRTNTIKI